MLLFFKTPEDFMQKGTLKFPLKGIFSSWKNLLQPQKYFILHSVWDVFDRVGAIIRCHVFICYDQIQ